VGDRRGLDFSRPAINLRPAQHQLYPASQLIVNKEGQLEFQLRKNPWKLVNIIDWNQAGAEK
jgi:hypothetical protein